MKKIFPILLLTVFFYTTGSVSAQKQTDVAQVYKEKADLDFRLFKFSTAAEMYLLTDTTNIEIVQKLGQAYRAIKSYEKAEHWLAKQATYPNQDDQLLLDYAEVLANNSKYRQSEEWYKKYVARHPADKRALNLSKAYSQLHNLKRDSANWNISYPSFNTNKDEFSPVYYNRGLIFSSNRDKKWGVSNVFGWNQTPFTDLYMVEDTAQVKYLVPGDYFKETRIVKIGEAHKQNLPMTIQDNKVLGNVSYPRSASDTKLEKDSTVVRLLRAGLNTFTHDGPMTFPDHYQMFYNRNQRETSSEKNEKLGIYKLNMFSGNYVGGQWYNVKPFQYNSKEYSTAHPALTQDGKILYFVSDKPGGMGGKDIYYCIKQDSVNWGQPINLGPEVNTEGDEAFPFISSDGKMYFSSTGHTGLGGLDLFYVSLKNNVPSGPVENMGYPVNSPKDDFGILFDNKMASGYFSSNRYGSDDIFKFNHKPILIDLEGKVLTDYFNGSKIAVPGALVELTYNGRTDRTYTNNVGYYSFKLGSNTDYSIKAEKSGFIAPATGSVTTVGIKKTTTLIKDLELAKPAPVDDCTSWAKIFKVDPVYFDLDKYNIRPDAAATMDKLVQLMKDYPELTVMVASHTDSRASFDYNVRLSNNRAMSTIRYAVEHGIERSRFSSEYFGERKLVTDCPDNIDCEEDKHQLNRRSEFYLFLKGRNITIECKL